MSEVINTEEKVSQQTEFVPTNPKCIVGKCAGALLSIKNGTTGYLFCPGCPKNPKPGKSEAKRDA